MDRGHPVTTFVRLVFYGGNSDEHGKCRSPQVRKVNAVAIRPSYLGETLADIRQVSDFSGHPNLLPEPVWSICRMTGARRGVIYLTVSEHYLADRFCWCKRLEPQ
jgi:hypothetical protein